jgi:hypothetical protein
MTNEAQKRAVTDEFVNALATRLQADQLGRATPQHMAATARSRAKAQAVLDRSEYEAAVLAAFRWAARCPAEVFVLSPQNPRWGN